ncbi:hypothetical protein [Xenorhabdus khoisanae]|uniref:hypothetical protein n=1 Tax=Xenorhabdus khoisanae TaxID=880157 RepID=UPI001379297A|nr:hypothetical protein [Xenorhabdus khoisanae]
MKKSIKNAKKYGEFSQKPIELEKCLSFITQEGYQVFPIYLKFLAQCGGVKGFHAN